MTRENETLSINSIAKKLQERLLKEGFTLQRYNAYSTNSVYFKLDYGVCNSLRISDHGGKQNLHYMFNLLEHAKESYTDKSGKYPRYIYPFKEFNSLIRHILHHRETRLQQLDELGYQIVMQKAKTENEGKAGFWENSFLVKSI